MVAQLEACDVTKNIRHLGFYQELEMRLKPGEMVIFFLLYMNNNINKHCMILATRFTFIVERS